MPDTVNPPATGLNEFWVGDIKDKGPAADDYDGLDTVDHDHVQLNPLTAYSTIAIMQMVVLTNSTHQQSLQVSHCAHIKTLQVAAQTFIYETGSCWTGSYGKIIVQITERCLIETLLMTAGIYL